MTELLFEVGVRVRVISSGVYRGEIGTVVRVDEANSNDDLPYKIELDNGGHRWVRADEIERADDDDDLRFKSGDYALVAPGGMGYSDDGSLVKIIKADSGVGQSPYKVLLNGTTYWYADSELAPATVEINTNDLPGGVHGVERGDRGTIVEVGADDDVLPYLVQFENDSWFWWLGREHFEFVNAPTPEEAEDNSEDQSEDYQFNVGDHVVIVTNDLPGGVRGVDRGHHGVITKLDHKDVDGLPYRVDFGSDYWWFGDEHLKLIGEDQPDDQSENYKFDIGQAVCHKTSDERGIVIDRTTNRDGANLYTVSTGLDQVCETLEIVLETQ